MKEITIKNKYKIVTVLLDDDDYERFSVYKWHWDGRYACRSERSKETNRYKRIYMHKDILHKDGLDTDHINGNKLDNRKCNLRLATRSQNLMNKRVVNRTGYKGVHYYARRMTRFWGAQITLNYKKITIGYFNTAIEAARAYDNAARTLHGEFARLNFPDMNTKKEKK